MPIFHRKIHRSYLDAQARAIANFINLQMVTSKKYFYSESYRSPILYFVLRASVTPSPFVSFYENKCLLVEKSLKPPFENGGNLRLRRFYICSNPAYITIVVRTSIFITFPLAIEESI
jgi:hypothetical protein